MHAALNYVFFDEKWETFIDEDAKPYAGCTFDGVDDITFVITWCSPTYYINNEGRKVWSCTVEPL